MAKEVENSGPSVLTAFIILCAAVCVLLLVSWAPVPDQSMSGGIRPAPEWARWVLLEREGLIATYSRRPIKTRNGWARIYPPRPAKPYMIHVRDDCRAKIVPAYAGLVPGWPDY